MITRALDAAIVLIAGALCLIMAFGGVDYELGPLTLRLHDLLRPTLLLAASVGVRTWLSRLSVVQWAFRALTSILAAACTVLVMHHVRVCGGLDSYGYVSTAALIRSGHLSRPQPLVTLLPFENAPSAAAPLGYIPGPRPHTEVPSFPLGLPLVMAAFGIFGEQGPFFVPLVMAFATIVLAFLIASRNDDGGVRAGGAFGSADYQILAGLLAAVLVAADPIFVDFAIQPMSDVPATCWLLASIWCAASGPALAAGFCAGMAFLTRPVLFPAAIVVGLITVGRPRRDVIQFAAMLLAFLLAQMMINLTLYGSVARSGYGRASAVFALSSERLTANISNFAKWITYSHTPIFWLVWPVALLVLRRDKFAWQVTAVAAAATLPYLFYFVFNDWEVPRFLLPTITLILVLTARALVDTVRLNSSNPRLLTAISVIATGVALIWASTSHRFLTREGAYRLRDFEAKYAAAGDWVKTHTPERAVVISALHSGSVRFYGNRDTVRWDQMPRGQLSPSLHNLQAAGHELYLLLDTSADEPAQFNERFADDPGFRLDPAGRVRVVNFYRLVSTP